jgi:hypothetical protein
MNHGDLRRLRESAAEEPGWNEIDGIVIKVKTPVSDRKGHAHPPVSPESLDGLKDDSPAIASPPIFSVRNGSGLN